jgi:hypothetical protein
MGMIVRFSPFAPKLFREGAWGLGRAGTRTWRGVAWPKVGTGTEIKKNMIAQTTTDKSRERANDCLKMSVVRTNSKSRPDKICFS